MPPSLSRSYSDYATEYESYDLPALLSEAATFDGMGALNQLMAFSTRLLDVLVDQDLSMDYRIMGIRLAIACRQQVEATLALDPARLPLYMTARDASYQRLLDFGKFPEVVRLAMPDCWQPPPK